MDDIKIGMGWLGTIFLFIFLTFGLTSYNTVMVFRGDSNTLKESTLYTDRRMAEQKVHVDQRSIELKEEYIGIAQRQDFAIHQLIFLTCTATHAFAECKKEQKELDQLKLQNPQDQ